MSRLYMYIPWTEFNAGDLKKTGAHSKWGNSGKTYTRVYYPKKKNQTTTQLTFTDTGSDVSIYIMGHGGAGKEYISNQYDYDHPVVTGRDTVNANQVVAGLKKVGLKTDFAGKIKCYSCHSAEGGADRFQVSFAAKMHSALNANGYKAVRLYAYVGVTSSYSKLRGVALTNANTKLQTATTNLANAQAQTTDPNDGMVQLAQMEKDLVEDDVNGIHKWLTVQGANNAGYAGSNNTSEVRAKYRRKVWTSTGWQIG